MAKNDEPCSFTALCVPGSTRRRRETRVGDWKLAHLTSTASLQRTFADLDLSSQQKAESRLHRVRPTLP